MGLEIPEPVQWLGWIIGADWPEGDETAMRRCAEAWRTAGTEVGELIEELNRTASDVRSALDSGAADAFGQKWEQWVTTDPQILPKLIESCGQLAETLDGGALDIEYAKYMFIALLIITAIEIAYLIAAAFATFGASTAAIPAVEAAAQVTARTIAKELLERLSRRFLGAVLRGAVVGAAEGGGLDLLIQSVQVAQGNRDGIDWSKTGAAALDGAIGGAISGGVSHGMGKVPGLGDTADTALGNMGRGMVREGLSEGISGVAGTVATAAVHGDPLTWEAIAKGATSGAFGGAVGGGRDGLEGYNSPVPGGDPPGPIGPPSPTPTPTPTPTTTPVGDPSPSPTPSPSPSPSGGGGGDGYTDGGGYTSGGGGSTTGGGGPSTGGGGPSTGGGGGYPSGGDGGGHTGGGGGSPSGGDYNSGGGGPSGGGGHSGGGDSSGGGGGGNRIATILGDTGGGGGGTSLASSSFAGGSAPGGGLGGNPSGFGGAGPSSSPSGPSSFGGTSPSGSGGSAPGAGGAPAAGGGGGSAPSGAGTPSSSPSSSSPSSSSSSSSPASSSSPSSSSPGSETRGRGGSTSGSGSSSRDSSASGGETPPPDGAAPGSDTASHDAASPAPESPETGTPGGGTTETAADPNPRGPDGVSETQDAMQQPEQGDSGGSPGFVAPMPMGMMGGSAGTAAPSGAPPPPGGRSTTPPGTESRPPGRDDPGGRPEPSPIENVDDDGVIRNEPAPPQDDAQQQDPPSRQDDDPPHKKESDGTAQDGTGPADGQSDRSQELADAEQQGRDALTQFGNDAPTVDFSSSPLDPAAAQEINNAIRQLAADYPGTMQGLSHIGSQDFAQSLGPGNDDVLAYATPGAGDPGIYINSDSFADNAQRAQDGADEEQSGFTVPGGGSTEGVFTHEFGHHLGEQLLNDPRMLADLNQAVSNALGIPYDATQPHDPATQQGVANGLSEYGSSDPHEMMAEAFTEYRLSGNPRDLSRAIGEVMDRHLGAQNAGNGTQTSGGSAAPGPNTSSPQNRAGENPAAGTPADQGRTAENGASQPRTDDTQPRTDDTQPRTDDTQPRTDGTQQRGGDEVRPGDGDPRFRRGGTDDDGDTGTPAGEHEPPSRTDPPAGNRLPHQQADWTPPSYTREETVDLESGDRLVDQEPLEPNTKYTVNEGGDSGNAIPRSEAYTDGDGNVTHVTNITPENPADPVVDPNDNVDLTRPEPGVTHKVELGFDEPHIFTGEPHGGGDGMAPSATTFDPPGDAAPTRWPGTYDVGADGPFSARQDLPPNSRIEVRGPDDRLHGVFWTDANGQVTHVRTWYGDQEHGFNPELGDSNANIRKWGVPRPDTHYLAEPHDRFQTGDPNAPLDPPDAARSGDFGQNGVEPGTFVFHTDSRGETDAASGRPDYDTPHSDEEQRNKNVQGKVGRTGKSADEYPGGSFDGGHIFPHEARGPGERVNYFPQWSPTNRGNFGGDVTPDTGWRHSFESLLEQRHADNGKITIERIDFFPEPNDPRVTPEVVHTRWTETDTSGDEPVTTTHYRSYHNLDPSQRGGGGTTPPAQPPGDGQPAAPNQSPANGGSQSPPAGPAAGDGRARPSHTDGSTTPESGDGGQPRFRRSSPAPEPHEGQAPHSDGQRTPPRAHSEESAQTPEEGTHGQAAPRPDAHAHYGWYGDAQPGTSPTPAAATPASGTPASGTPASGTATETATPRSGDGPAPRIDGGTGTGSRLQDASVPPMGGALPRTAEGEGPAPRTADPELMRRVHDNEQIRQVVDEARGTVVDDRGNRLGDLLADDLRNRLPNHPHLARIIEGDGPPPLTPAESSLRHSLLARPRTLHSLLSNPDAVHILEDSVREVNERGADTVLREGQVEPTPTPFEDWQIQISDRAIEEIGPGKSPKQPGFDEAALDAERERAGDQPLSKDNEFVNRYLDELYQRAEEGTGPLRRVLDELANEPDDAKMRPGPKDRVRALDKVINESDGDASALNDLLGGKVQFDGVSDLYRALDRVVDVARRHDVEVVSIKDRLRKPQPSGYRDIRMTVRMPNGHIGELRLHLRSFDNVADYEHSLYEVSRDLPNVAEERAARGERDAPLTPEERAVREVVNRRLNERFESALNEALPPHLRTTGGDGGGPDPRGEAPARDDQAHDAGPGRDGEQATRQEDAGTPENVPDGLPPHLHDAFRDSEATPAGRSFHDPADPAMRDLARRVPADPQRFTVDGHGDADGLRLGGGRRLDADDLAQLIRNDPDWNGREVLLLSCRTGDGDFAARLAQRLGVPVTAPNGLAWSDGDGNVYASSGRTGPDGGTRPGWPPDGTWRTFGPDGTTSTAGHDGRPPGREEHRGTDPARPADDAEARGLRDWFRREGHVDRDGYRRFGTDEHGERYGENRLAHVYDNLPHRLQQALHWYTVQSMPNPQLRPGADVGRYLTHLYTEQNYVQHLAHLNGGTMPAHRGRLMQMWNRPDLTDYQRRLIQHVVTQADPEARLQEMWQNHEQREFLRRYLGGEPTPDAFWRRIDELDQALSRPLPEPVEAVRGLHDVNFMLASDGAPLAGRHPMLLVGAVQSEPGYMSTSLGSGTTEVDGQGFAYQLHLNLPEGAHGVWMGRSSAYPDQRELVLPRGTRYYIRSVTQTGWNGTQPVFSVQADVIPPGAAP